MLSSKSFPKKSLVVCLISNTLRLIKLCGPNRYFFHFWSIKSLEEELSWVKSQVFITGFLWER